MLLSWFDYIKIFIPSPSGHISIPYRFWRVIINSQHILPLNIQIPSRVMPKICWFILVCKLWDDTRHRRDNVSGRKKEGAYYKTFLIHCLVWWKFPTPSLSRRKSLLLHEEEKECCCMLSWHVSSQRYFSAATYDQEWSNFANYCWMWLLPVWKEVLNLDITV